MRKEIIAIGIIAIIAVCATMAMANQSPTNQVIVPIEMTPDTLNLNSGGEYITAFIYENDLNGIDPMTLYLTDGTNTVDAVAVCYDNEPLLAIKFPRATVLGWLNVVDEDSETTFESSVNLYVKSDDAPNTVFTDEFNIVESKKKH